MYTGSPRVNNFTTAVKGECLVVSFVIEKFLQELTDLGASYTIFISCRSQQSAKAEIPGGTVSMNNGLIICSSNKTNNDNNTVGEILNNCSPLLLSPILSVNG